MMVSRPSKLYHIIISFQLIALIIKGTVSIMQRPKGSTRIFKTIPLIAFYSLLHR